MNLSEQTILVIGGSSGIGRAVAAAAQSRGARVIVGGRSEEHLAEVEKEISGIETCTIDVRDVRAMDYCLEEVAPIDHLVYSAADLNSAAFQDVDIAEAKRMFDTKFWGAFAAAQSASRFIPAGGSITLFSGVAARMPVRGLSVVAAINSAIEGLTRSMALELGPIRVNAVSPGFVNTHGADEDRLQQLREGLPAHHVGAAEDIAHAVLFLMENRYATGSVLAVDGGRSIV